jgi:ATP-binding cassette subfamily C protein/ATP-binding cassette subfamily C protein EexD
MSETAGRPARKDPLARALESVRAQFAAVFAFSGVVNALQLTVPLYMLQLFDRVLAARNTDTLIHLTVITVFCLLVMAVLEATRSIVMQRLAAWVEWRAAPAVFDRALEAQLRGQPAGMEALRDLQTLRGFLASPASLVLNDIPWAPVYFAVIFLIHPLLGWVALGGALALFGLTVLSEALTARLLREAAPTVTAAQRSAEAMARNALAIDALGMGRAVRERWQRRLAEAQPGLLKAGDRSAIILAATKFARFAVQVAVLGLGAWLVLRQEATPGASIAASIIMARALAPVEQLIGGWRQLVLARQSRARLRAFLARPPLRPTGTAPPVTEGRLTAERVVFGFAGQGTPLIKGVSLALAPGEGLALVGPSAAGKSTLLRLLAGSLPPQQGTVRLDGADVFLWPREDFGRHVGYLPQEVELFSGTVLENIARLGPPDPEAAFAAARRAACHDMILRLPQGYDTEIGEGGQHLSGGQRQMIGLARALYGGPRVLLLDEPNSNLDGETEARLTEALLALKAAGTSFVVVSHRPALLKAVDKVMVLREGAVEAFGPRDEVLARLMGGPRPGMPLPPGVAALRPPPGAPPAAPPPAATGGGA